jgi:hypothetical protein
MNLLNNRVIAMIMLLFSYLSADQRYAFIYSKNIDDRFINFYDKIVVEADAIDNIYAIRYPKKMVAYVSVGEIEPWRKTKNPYKKSWVISKNRTWNSLIGDLRKDEYQTFIFDRIDNLYKRGYRNFFLDTMDAYHVTREDKVLFEKQKKALISFIHKLHKKYPKSKIIINRGFELLDKINKDIDAVVAESLLKRYNHAKKEYIEVPKADREWLLANFEKAKKYGLDTISIEYSNKGTKERRKIAKKIKKLGSIPYVTDGLLQEQGECDIERVRRNILILFNKSLFKDKNAVYSDVHLLASMPIEHLGYIPILYDISTSELPKSVEDKYHSVIIWSDGVTQNDKLLHQWILNLKKRGIKFLFFNNFVFEPTDQKLQNLNLTQKDNHNNFISKKEITYNYPYIKYEIPASPEYEHQLINTEDGRAVLSVRYENGQKSKPIAITSWGGYAIGNSFMLSIADENYWTIDPFRFLKDALRLDEIPVPDPTTESGRRIIFVHVDGDGFVEKVRTNMDRLSTEYLIKHIYKKYKIPQTVSLIQGEIESRFPKLTPKMKKISKELYRIPWIEPASHTLSHPFLWNEVIKPQNAKPSIGKKYHLAIANYNFSLEKETIGSVDFALSFAPKTKQREKVLFWTGDCIPPREVLEFVEKRGILTMNGGDTTISKTYPWLGHIAPFGLQREEYWQIYTGQQNENVYTNEWLGPYWGYREVIETFEMTDKPRRLKPINIYYHLYSGSRVASLNALDEVYSWAIKQKTSKLYASQYIKKARGFYATSIAKIDGGYEIRNSGYLRTVRFDKRVDVDIKSSKGVAGFVYENGRTYITLDRSIEHKIKFSQNSTTSPYLIDSNGWVERVSHRDKSYSFELKSNISIDANFYMPSSCKVNTNGDTKIKRVKPRLSISSNQLGVTVAFECK